LFDILLALLAYLCLLVYTSLSVLAKAEGRSVQELAEKLMEEAIKDEEDMILIERVAERDVPGAETVKSEDVDWDKILSAETIKDEEHKQKYDIVYLKDVLEKDFPNLPPAARSKVKKVIDERLTTDPINLGKPLRGRSEDIEED
uniref:Uncharacterized protein n=1 Tax=Glossina austeni TaxID=7395 RepID=A0A1A9UCW9_GLOAU